MSISLRKKKKKKKKKMAELKKKKKEKKKNMAEFHICICNTWRFEVYGKIRANQTSV